MSNKHKLTQQDVGICSVGSYVPRLRLLRSAIANANSWANPGLIHKGKGVRAICAHDEDSLTMAVAAARAARKLNADCRLSAVQFSSTTPPFADRQNAVILSEALSLPESLHTSDATGSMRCATASLITALKSGENHLVAAADKRKTRPASSLEMTSGDGAAAIETGTDRLLARFLASYSLAIDLTDHYRASESEFDYELDERWVKEEGHLEIIPKAINHLLREHNINPAEIKHLILPLPDQRTATKIAKLCGVAAEAVTNNLHLDCGHTGSAHPFLMFNYALETARPGDKLLMVGFGQGCDVLLFEATSLVTQLKALSPVRALLEQGERDDNYMRYLSFNSLIKLDWGIRAERDNRTSQSAFFRQRKAMTGFIGGRCQACNTPQFPRNAVCVNPDCRRPGEQANESFKDKAATMKSYTEDWLAVSHNPPLMYGNVRFEGGGVVMMEYADFSPGDLKVGTPVSMQFRIKDEDSRRGFKRYFWKAAPLN